MPDSMYGAKLVVAYILERFGSRCAGSQQFPDEELGLADEFTDDDT
jgi:hypothetical protein